MELEMKFAHSRNELHITWGIKGRRKILQMKMVIEMLLFLISFFFLSECQL